MLPDQEIAATLQELPGPQEASDRLIELAKQHGGQDNITVIVARLGPRPNAWFSKLRRRTRNSRSPASHEGGA
jgi:serine/threonine protein phosphatase PrpC